MSIFGAMFSGVSGLRAQSQMLGMISDNISNVNTVGYKGSVAQFSTLVTDAASATSFTPGGVQSNTNQLIDKQGLLQSSTSKSDISIVGSGFFVVNDASTPSISNEFLYTRAGSFNPDKDGFLRNVAGYYMMGWPTDAQGVVTAANPSVLSSLEAVTVTGISGSAVQTTAASAGLNLAATAVNTDTHLTAMQIYDSLGIEHTVTLTFTKTANPLEWTLDVSDPTQVGGGVSGTTTYATQTITFNGNGTLATPATWPNIAIAGWTTGASNSTIALDLGTQNLADGLTQYASEYATYFINQNGIRFGTFNEVSIDENGLVSALFDNGQTTPIYQIPVATFNNINGLEGLTGNVFRESDRSGAVLLNTAGSGPAGSIAPSSLEASSVDIANEFTSMIITQQAYSASARIITTADEMLQEVLRIGR
ncbi:MAG TPA: flagellar hook protein FlgE [Alphaproteobacteria bacterium]|nr:flagellar hook protein FlgE [Alphaproteobacteria bacterium]